MSDKSPDPMAGFNTRMREMGGPVKERLAQDRERLKKIRDVVKIYRELGIEDSGLDEIAAKMQTTLDVMEDQVDTILKDLPE